jgi:outer membrane protein
MTRMKISLFTLLASAALALPALAQSAGDMTLGLGLAGVMPKDGNGTLAGAAADVGNNVRPSITFEYFIRDNLGIEVLGALPFKHDIFLGGAFAGTTKHLPPTVSLNYHIPTGGKVTPFVGVGLNYTTFFEESSDLGDLKIKDSWGLAASLGADYAVSDKGSLRIELRYIDIDSDVTLDGAPIGKVKIDPLVAVVSYVMKF